MSILLTGSAAERPNRLKGAKDKQYDLTCGRYYISLTQNERHAEYLKNLRRNKNFISPNKQWEEKEDYTNFLMDDSGKTTSRIKVELNYCQVMHNQFYGNAARMKIRAKVQSYSPLVKVRKEQSLNEMLMWQDAAQLSSPEVAATIKANKPIGASDFETATLHHVFYSDKHIKAMNNLMKYCANINNLSLKQNEAADTLSYGGIAIMRPEPVNGEYRVRWVQPEKFFWDRDAREFDLSDAGFMGEYQDITVSELHELAVNMDREDRALVESYANSWNVTGEKSPDRIRTYMVVWKDVNIHEWGYVRNEFDDIVFERINYKYEHEEKARYTDSDLVAISDLTPYQLEIIKKKNQQGGKAKTIGYTDQWRFCEFIPSEFLATAKSKSTDKLGDVVIDSGVLPYQEQNLYSPFNMETPYKVGMYMYLDGYVYSPIDIAINPQRIANRLMSVIENTINNSKSEGTVILEEAIDNSEYHDDLADISRRMKTGDPIVLSAVAVGGVQNAVGKYSGSIGEGTARLFDVSQSMLQIIEKITGVNEAMKGQMERPDQLVGTMQLMIQKGTVVTERYYSALRELMRQIYQSFTTSGKRFYINEKPKLVSMVGDEDVEVIELSKDMKNEDFRATVTFSMDEQSERQMVDTMLLQFLQMGLIDKESFANIIGRGSLDDMWEAIRRYAKELTEAEKAAAEQAQAQAQQGQQQQQQNVDNALNVQQNKIDADIMQAAMKQEMA